MTYEDVVRTGYGSSLDEFHAGELLRRVNEEIVRCVKHVLRNEKKVSFTINFKLTPSFGDRSEVTSSVTVVPAKLQAEALSSSCKAVVVDGEGALINYQIEMFPPEQEEMPIVGSDLSLDNMDKGELLSAFREILGIVNQNLEDRKCLSPRSIQIKFFVISNEETPGLSWEMSYKLPPRSSGKIFCSIEEQREGGVLKWMGQSPEEEVLSIAEDTRSFFTIQEAA